MLIAAWLGAMVGVPVPSASTFTTTADENFPCKNHGCGCRTAEMCRTACCCFKPEPVTTSCCSAKPEESKPARAAFEALKCQNIDGWNLLHCPIVAVVSVPAFNKPSLPAVVRRHFSDSIPASNALEVAPPPPRPVV